MPENPAFKSMNQFKLLARGIILSISALALFFTLLAAFHPAWLFSINLLYLFYAYFFRLLIFSCEYLRKSASY